jgi:adenylosuccinate lyase
LSDFGKFAGTERLLMELVKVGADRQEMHEIIRAHAQAAWVEIREGNPNPIQDLLVNETALKRYLEESQISAYLDHTGYLGDAIIRASKLAKMIRQVIST